MENDIKKLLKQSLLKIPSEDFTDRMMEKILAEAQKQSKPSREIKWSWFFMSLAVILLPIGLLFLIRLLSLYDPYLLQYIPKFSNSILIQLIIAITMALILLLQLNNLIDITISHKKYSYPTIRSPQRP